jgi:NhaA family Na+:H+ antiporter
MEQLARAAPETLTSHALAETLRAVAVARREAMSPSESLIEMLHPWVAFGIMPVFALANAGVVVQGASFDELSSQVMVGTIAGLVLGKPLGVLVACAVSLKLGIAVLPVGLTRRHLVVLGAVAGVGFTMALFIAHLAFASAPLLAAAKLGVLVASGVAAIAALALGGALLRPQLPSAAAQTADEAESSTTV